MIIAEHRMCILITGLTLRIEFIVQKGVDFDRCDKVRMECFLHAFLQGRVAWYDRVEH
jgi:hypothetical protein